MLDFIDRCHSLSSLLLPQAALTSLPYAVFFGYFLVRTQESDTCPISEQNDKLKFEGVWKTVKGVLRMQHAFVDVIIRQPLRRQ